MNVKIRLENGAQTPQYATKGSAGFDIAANEEVIINSGETTLVSTGLFVEVPEGYELQIRPRSGTSLKTGIRIANAPGTIDSDYRGEVKLIVSNMSPSALKVQIGDRIAQGVLQAVTQASFQVEEELSSTERGAGGFGSTGETITEPITEPTSEETTSTTTEDVDQAG
jgi:dUTP pyrophosphatase